MTDPEASRPGEPPPPEPGEGGGGPARPVTATATTVTRTREERLAPTWRWILVLVVAALLVLALRELFSRASPFLMALLFSLFLSFAIEPAANALSRRGWGRGWSTLLVFVGVLIVVGGLVVLMIPPVISAAAALISALQDGLPRLATFTEQRFGFSLSSPQVQAQLSKYASDIAKAAGNVFLDLFGFGAGLVGAAFQILTVALFTFYLVAYGPQLRRFVCSYLPPRQQRDVLWIWDTAIDKTGAYFYSRLLMAIINGVGLFIVLQILGVPYALPLAAFTALVSAFIPTIGTYIGGAVPVLVAVSSDVWDGVIVLAYIVVYQQIENMLISPKLSGRTMQLNEGVTFGAAILGGYLGGPLMAFLAIPVAAVLQAIVTAYGTRYEVVHDQLMIEAEGGPEAPTSPPGTADSWLGRLSRRFREEGKDRERR